MINIGYACLAIAVPGSGMKNTLMKNATGEHLFELIEHNLTALERLIDYNIRQGIKLFRISSDLIPFGSSIAGELPWPDVFSEKLTRIGGLIRAFGMRVSMHPGQYTVLNSPDPLVVERAIADLAYHTQVLDAFGVGSECKIILHLGGVYGDKEQAIGRFIHRYQELPAAIKRRLVLENDDRLFNIRDILEAAKIAGFPVVYDNLHNAVNPADPSKTDADWIRTTAATWGPNDGPQKIHYSQQDPAKRIGAHSPWIKADLFLDFYQTIQGETLDIMLEVKDKNLSALKCLNLVSNHAIKHLENEWARYKYTILEHSPVIYQSIRTLLKSKTDYPVREFYELIEAALSQSIVMGQATNAADHVWGYFKNQATASERRRYSDLLSKYEAGESRLELVKNHLLKLAVKYQEDYLLTGYYFDL